MWHGEGRELLASLQERHAAWAMGGQGLHATAVAQGMGSMWCQAPAAPSPALERPVSEHCGAGLCSFKTDGADAPSSRRSNSSRASAGCAHDASVPCQQLAWLPSGGVAVARACSAATKQRPLPNHRTKLGDNIHAGPRHGDAIERVPLLRDMHQCMAVRTACSHLCFGRRPATRKLDSEVYRAVTQLAIGVCCQETAAFWRPADPSVDVV